MQRTFLARNGTTTLVPVVVLSIGILSMFFAARLSAQELPIGIPAPSFGFVDSHEMYSTDANYTIGQFGPFSHYVDNTDPSCSDLFNDGTIAKPRCSIPTDLDAGDVVEVHGGPYQGQDDWVFQMPGTRDAPIFVRGVDEGNGYPIIDSEDPRNGRVYLNGSYAVFENFRLDTTGLRIGTPESSSDHLAARNLDINWHHKTCVMMSADHSLIMGSEIHHCRDPVNDRHGIQVSGGTNFTWILNNHIHHNSGNGIQYTHQAEGNLPENVFIGGNHLHSDREVGISSKWAGKTIVSSNIIHSYKSSQAGVEWCYDDDTGCMIPESGANGPGIVFGSDGYPLNKWVIYNIIYDTNQCIRNEDSVKGRIIGNICANIQASGVTLEKSSPDLYIVNNTFFNTGIDGKSGVIQQDWRDQFDINVQNNLIISPAGRALCFEQTPVMNKMEFNNNLIWNDGASFPVLWKNDVVEISTLAELRNLIENDLAEMSDNQVTDPGLSIRSAPTPFIEDFVPSDNSALVGAGSDVLLQLDAEFKATFGSDVTIIRDEWRDHQFDIGAIPNGFGVAVVAPMPPILE